MKALQWSKWCVFILVVNVLGLVHATGQTQNDKLKLYQEYLQNIPQEKVFLHLDKTQYAASETIWVKAYLVAGAMHMPSQISKNIYLELVSEQGNIEQRLILKAENGLSQASIALDSALTTGDYYLRAYTNWMKNFNPEFFFNKKIRIVNLNEQATMVPEEPKDYPLSLRFYPEGGHLVQNIASKMAFEITAAPQDFKQYSGIIYDQNDQQVSTFKTTHENRGMINFLPKSTGYYALLDNHDLRFDLPVIEKDGMVMLVNNKDDKHLIVTLKASEAVAQEYFLVAHTRGYITYASRLSLRGGRGFAKIDKSTLPAGVSHITLMNIDMAPLAERLAFIQGEGQINLNIKTDKSGYDTRELVTVQLEAKDFTGKPIQGSFSLSAYNQDLAINDQDSYHIKANLLLSSDLKGYIHNPGQYFESSNEARQNLDLLMMVKGWSRFSWEQIASKEIDLNYLPESGLNLSGKLLRSGTKRIKNGKLLLLNQHTNESLLAITREDGSFQFQDMDFNDTTELIFQGTHKKGFKNVSLEIDSTFEKLPLISIPSRPLELSRDKQVAFKEQFESFVSVRGVWKRRNGYTDLGEVTITAKQEALRDGRLSGVPDVFDFKEIPYEEKRRKDAFRVMLGRVPGLNFGYSTGPNGNEEIGLQVPRMGFGERWRMVYPTIMLDGIVVEAQDIYGIDPTTIDYVVTSRTYPGLIAVYTMSAERYAKNMPKPGLFIMNLPGYHSATEFYAPRYDGKNPNADLPDDRITLTWEPMITTNAAGKAEISFYTSDQEGTIGINVQGISLNGQAAHGSKSISINSNF